MFLAPAVLPNPAARERIGDLALRCKYYFIMNKLAYTEDNVLVYNLCLDNVPEDLTEKDLFEYFGRYGKIRELKISPKKYSPKPGLREGVVQYYSAESAYNALSYRRLASIKNYVICVEPDGSWNQPDADLDRYGSPELFDINFRLVQDTSTILSLDNDCLEIILSNLTLREQINCARACRRFRDIFSLYARRRYKIYNLYELNKETLWYARDFFRFAGANIERLLGDLCSGHSTYYIDFVQTYCYRLKELHLGHFSVYDDIIKSFKHLNQLEKLTAAHNTHITGKYISHFKHLIELDLSGCGLKIEHMEAIVRNLTKLEILDINRTTVVTESLIEEMIIHSQKLKVFKFAVRECNYHRVAHLPSLKHLEVTKVIKGHSHISKLLQELCEQKADELESLSIYSFSKIPEREFDLISKLKKLKILDFGNIAVTEATLIKLHSLEELEELSVRRSKKITDNSLLELVKFCKRLYHLDVHNCREITINFVMEVIPLLERSFGERNNKMLFLYADNTKITSSLLNTFLPYKTAVERDLLEVIFDEPPLQYEEDESDPLKKYRFHNYFRQYSWLRKAKSPTCDDWV